MTSPILLLISLSGTRVRRREFAQIQRVSEIVDVKRKKRKESQVRRLIRGERERERSFSSPSRRVNIRIAYVIYLYRDVVATEDSGICGSEGRKDMYNEQWTYRDVSEVANSENQSLLMLILDVEYIRAILTFYLQRYSVFPVSYRHLYLKKRYM